ncbi:hypothetical protein YC2023_115622 [Brassica napus]
MIRFPPAKERPLDLEVHVIFWCSREVGEAERGVKGSQFSSFLKPSSCDGGTWRRKSGSRCRSEVQLFSFQSPPPPLLFFIFPASVASAPAEDTGSLYRRFALVSFKFLFQFRLPPVLAPGRCRLPPFGSRRRLRVERLVFSLGM